MDLTADQLTFADVAELEARERHGTLSEDDAHTLRAARRKLKSVAARFSAMVSGFAEEYKKEFAYVDSLPGRKRKMYEHMTMRDVRRMMRRSPACVGRVGHQRSRSSHRSRPGHRRVRSTRAGPSDDPGPGEPPRPRLTLAPKPGARYTFAVIGADMRGADVEAVR